jgi:transposase
MVHSTKAKSNELRETVVRMRAENMLPVDIKRLTGVAESTQRLYVQKSRTGTLAIKKPSRLGHLNGRAKRPEDYALKLRALIATDGTLYDPELASKMTEITNCQLSPVQVGRIRKELGITRKKLSIHFPERFLIANVKKAEQFCIVHRRINPEISLQHCSSTDECGFKNDLKRTHGKSQVKSTRTRSQLSAPIHKTAGESYNENESRVYGINVKMPSKLVNLIATICLDPINPVPGFQFEDKNVDGVTFSYYIDNMNYPAMVQYDLIDGATFHSADAINIKKRKVPVIECYETQEVIPDYVPKGYPEYNPVEQLFDWLKQYLRTNAKQYINNGIWTKEKIIIALQEARTKVTHEMVKGWYRNSFSHMHPGKRVPKYLC